MSLIVGAICYSPQEVLTLKGLSVFWIMRSIFSTLFLSIALLLICQLLPAQGAISYSHSTAGDLTNRTASGNEERSIQSSFSHDSLFTKEQILERLGIQQVQNEKQAITPPRFFNKDSIALRRSRILARLRSRTIYNI